MAEQDTDTEQEPSIEEILTSIRQIISDDEDEDTSASSEDAAPAVEPEPEEIQAGKEKAEDEDGTQEPVIELTDIVGDDSDLQDEAEPEPEPVQVEMQDAMDDFKEPESSEPEPSEPVSEADDPSDMQDKEDPFETILTQKARSAALEGFTDLVRKTAIEHNGITLEEIVRTELNPLLRDWLDRHLPSIIERLVREELDRIAKRALEE